MQVQKIMSQRSTGIYRAASASVNATFEFHTLCSIAVKHWLFNA